jgi:hypothetical protein
MTDMSSISRAINTHLLHNRLAVMPRILYSMHASAVGLHQTSLIGSNERDSLLPSGSVVDIEADAGGISDRFGASTVLSTINDRHIAYVLALRSLIVLCKRPSMMRPDTPLMPWLSA